MPKLNGLKQRVTIGDRTFMAAATPAQIATLEKRLREYGLDAEGRIELDFLFEVEAEVLGYGASDDETITGVQVECERQIIAWLKGTN